MSAPSSSALPSQDDLQLVLVNRGERRGAEVAHLLALVRLLCRIVLTRKRLGANGDPAEVIATRKAGRPDGRLESDLTKQLNRALGEPARSRVDQQIGVAFDEERLHAMPAQEEGGRQARQPAPDNQDRRRLVNGCLAMALCARPWCSYALPGICRPWCGSGGGAVTAPVLSATPPATICLTKNISYSIRFFKMVRGRRWRCQAHLLDRAATEAALDRALRETSAQTVLFSQAVADRVGHKSDRPRDA